jgi:hypothetical protein
LSRNVGDEPRPPKFPHPKMTLSRSSGLIMKSKSPGIA